SGAGANASLYRVAIDPVTRNVLVIGAFSSRVDLNPAIGITLVTAVGNQDALVAEYTPTFGLVRHGLLFGVGGPGTGTGTVFGYDLAPDANGDVWVAGTFLHSVTGGLATLTNADPTGNSGDAYLLKLHANGAGYTTLIARSYGAAGDD